MSTFGRTYGRSYANTYGRTGQAVPLVVDVTVRATRRGWFGGYVRQVDETFTINHPEQFTSYWMTLVDPVPASWVGYIDLSYSQQLDEYLLTPITTADIKQKISQVGGPYGAD